MSLVELIISGAVGALLLTGIVLIFSQGLIAQGQQAARNELTSQLNSTSSFVNESLRNAVEARVVTDQNRLDMRVLNATGDAFECRSWRVAGNLLQYSSNAGGNWSTLISGLTAPTEGTLGFSQSGQSIAYVLSKRDGEVEVTIRDGGYPGTLLELGGPRCW